MTTTSAPEGLCSCRRSRGPLLNCLSMSGKEGTIFLANRANLGGYDPNTDNNLQTLHLAVGGIYGAPAYWNSTVYFWGVRDYLKAFSITNGMLSLAPVATGIGGHQLPNHDAVGFRQRQRARDRLGHRLERL